MMTTLVIDVYGFLKFVYFRWLNFNALDGKISINEQFDIGVFIT